MTTPSVSALAIIDSETYDLRYPPPTTSRLVHTARDHLLADLDLPSLSSDLTRISLLLSLAHKASVKTCDTPLTTQITTLSSKVEALYTTSASLLSLCTNSARTVLDALPHTHALLSHRHISAAVHALCENDQLADSLVNAAATLSVKLSTAADHTLRAVESAQAIRASREQRRHELEDLSTELRVRRAAAWHTHQAMLESLAEAGRLYERAARAERRASARVMLFSVFGLVDRADQFLVACFGIPWLAPVRKLLDGVRQHATHAGEERRALLTAKRRQRKLHREALREVAECGGKIQKVGGEVDAIDTAIESLRAVAGELKRLSVVVMRMAAFWGQLKENVGRLSSAELVMLIQATSGGDAEEAEEDEDGILNASSVEVWLPGMAVKRKIIGYYARWVALGDVCKECLNDIVSAKEKAYRIVEEGGEELTPASAAGEISKMAADLCEEMEKVDSELERYRVDVPTERKDEHFALDT